jgi:DNA-binding PadR family transcriptional regulator
MAVYELFVLGELMDQPAHGYLLHSIIKTAVGPIRKLSWGALYPLIRRLEREGLIAPVAAMEAVACAGADGRQRKVYGITEAGRARFFALMAEPGAYDTEYPDLFSIKLSNFHHVDRDPRLEILRHYRGYVQLLQSYMQTARRRVEAEPRIPEAERPYILRVIDHRLHVARADIQWIEAEIASTAHDGTAPLERPVP